MMTRARADASITPMKTHKKLWSTLIAVLVMFAIGATAFGQPAKDRKDRRKDRQEARKDRQEARKERREERRQAVADKLTPEQKKQIEEYKAKLAEMRETFKAKVDELAAMPPEQRREEIKKLVEQAAEDFRAALGEAGAKIKAKGEELRLEWEATKKRYEDLKEKEKAGTLTPEEKEELAKMQEKVDKAKKAKEELEKALKTGAEKLKKAIEPHKDEILKAWGEWILANETAQSELEKHAKRMAELTAAKEIAKAEGRDELVKHIDELIKLEKKRHEEAMKLLQSKEGK